MNTTETEICRKKKHAKILQLIFNAFANVFSCFSFVLLLECVVFCGVLFSRIKKKSQLTRAPFILFSISLDCKNSEICCFFFMLFNSVYVYRLYRSGCAAIEVSCKKIVRQENENCETKKRKIWIDFGRERKFKEGFLTSTPTSVWGKTTTAQRERI